MVNRIDSIVRNVFEWIICSMIKYFFLLNLSNFCYFEIRSRILSFNIYVFFPSICSTHEKFNVNFINFPKLFLSDNYYVSNDSWFNYVMEYITDLMTTDAIRKWLFDGGKYFNLLMYLVIKGLYRVKFIYQVNKLNSKI